MAAFPAIRKPLRDGWRGPQADGVRRTAMEQGPSKLRVESTAEPSVESFAWKLSDADAATLRNFYAANKAGRHTWTHPKWNVAVEVQFVGPIEWSEVSNWTLAQARLEVFY